MEVKKNSDDEQKGINSFAIGKEVIIRTYSAGVWFGVLKQKAGNEVILTKARRMWSWWAKESISLSGVARYGIKQENSRIAAFPCERNVKNGDLVRFLARRAYPAF